MGNKPPRIRAAIFDESIIPAPVLTGILEAGIQAPSAKNRQPWHFVVVRSKAKTELIDVLKDGIEREKAGKDLLPGSRGYAVSAENSLRIIAEAPVTVLVLNTRNGNDPVLSMEEKFSEMAHLQSVGACIQNMLLAAESHGIGSVWICDIYFAYRGFCAWLETDRQIAAAVSFGYAAEAPPARPRRPLDRTVEWRE